MYISVFSTSHSVKRDTPSSSSSNLNQQQHQTAILENLSSLITNKSASVELTTSTNLMKIPTISSTTSLFVQSPVSSPLITIGNFNKLSKYSTNFNSQDSSLFNFPSQENSTEKKLVIDNSPTTSFDASRFCRFIFPDSTSAVILASNSNLTIQQAINRLFAKRGITWYRTELYTTDQQSIDIQEPLSNLCGKEVYVESRILIRIDFPSKILCVRCDPKRTLLQILVPIVEKLKYSLKQLVFYANDSLTPLSLNELVGSFDNQRIFTLIRTAADVSSRQKIRTANDIFDMISENDEDIKFDECGILKIVTRSKSTTVISTGDLLHSPSPETSPTLFENDKIYCGPRR